MKDSLFKTLTQDVPIWVYAIGSGVWAYFAIPMYMEFFSGLKDGLSGYTFLELILLSGMTYFGLVFVKGLIGSINDKKEYENIDKKLDLLGQAINEPDEEKSLELLRKSFSFTEEDRKAFQEIMEERNRKKNQEQGNNPPETK